MNAPRDAVFCIALMRAPAVLAKHVQGSLRVWPLKGVSLHTPELNEAALPNRENSISLKGRRRWKQRIKSVHFAQKISNLLP